jgi:ketosteroid isomerase-like protein
MFVDEKLTKFRSLAGEMFPHGVSLKIGLRPIESENFAVVEGEGFGYAKSGKVYNNRYAFLFESRNGQISSIREYLDTLHAQDVFGDVREGVPSAMPEHGTEHAVPANSVEKTMADAWRCFSDGDIDGFARCFSDDATWWTDSGRERVRGRFDLTHSAQDGTPFHGVVPMTEKVEYIRTRVQRSYGGRTIVVTPTRFFSDSTRVAAEAVGNAMLANGRAYQNRYLLIADIADKRIGALREYCDTLHIADVTGIGID